MEKLDTGCGVKNIMLSIDKLLEEKITTEEHLDYLFKITTGKGLSAWWKPKK